MAEQVTKAIKKKSWFQLIAPRIFDNLVLGETTVSEPEKLIGRVVSINLATLTNDLRQQSINIKFKVVSIEGTKAHTEVIGCTTSPSAIKRLVRRATTRMDETLVFKTADNKTVVLKLFIVTKVMVRSSTAQAIRKAIPEILQKEISKITFENLIRLLITNKLQMGLKSSIKKIYPLRSCEVKTLKIVSESKKPKTNQKKQEEPKEENEGNKEINTAEQEEKKEAAEEEKPKEENKQKKKEEKMKKEEKAEKQNKAESTELKEEK